MDDVIQVSEQHYVLATSSLANSVTRVLKYGDTFAVFDVNGDIRSPANSQQGLYYRETRHISSLVLRLEGKPFQLLGSTVKDRNSYLAVDLTNLDSTFEGELYLPRGTLHFFRSNFIWENTCYERIRIVSFAQKPAYITLSWDFDADFVDIFEVRGSKRERRGTRQPDSVNGNCVKFEYDGLDGVHRATELQFSPAPRALTSRGARYEIEVAPHAEAFFYLQIHCSNGARVAAPPDYKAANQEIIHLNERVDERRCHIATSNPRFNDWLRRSEADLQMMTVGNPEGPYPYAGIPWFNTVFGRDGIITAYELLWLAPVIAKGVLQFLGQTQATENIPEQDAEPGKILHELRRGEMAATKEVPFGRYYGSIDSTPLYVMLAAAYYERTADLEFIRKIWPNIQRALTWMLKYGDPDGDGFIEYARRSQTGLIQQGWKDSHDSIFHADGRLADAPIAVCEVQGYAYAAKLGAARLAEALEDSDSAKTLRESAFRLRQAFDDAFWNEELGTYALALDGEKKQCAVTTSNPGHCLSSGIAFEHRASRIADSLLDMNLYSGWGIRTVGAREVRYNPMSYHNGSVWPHDNAIIAHGLARYNLTRYSLRVLESMFEASVHFDANRMPELFCGFRRRAGDGPTLYPVACSPQSWASASIYMLLQACLGMTVNGVDRHIHFRDSCLPESVQWLNIENLTVANCRVDFTVRRLTRGVEVEVHRRDGELEIAVMK